MPLQIGTEPFKILAIADTGSYFTWTQCEPCIECFPQRAKKFKPTHSVTFKPVLYSDLECYSSDAYINTTEDNNGRCKYKLRYGDGSTSSGVIAKDSITLGTKKFTKITLGCGFKNIGEYSPYTSGVIGLGNGPYSLIGQIGHSIDSKFGYCLGRKKVGSKSGYISFGEDRLFTGSVSTPLISKKHEPFYFLTIEAITIGKVRVPLKRHEHEKGNMIIDSGTTHLKLPAYFYKIVEKEIEKQLRKAGGKQVRKTKWLKLCYEKKSFTAPEIVINFEGADIKLNHYNLFLPSGKDVICFISSPSDTDYGVYGYNAQRDFLVGYDRGKKRITFKPADCRHYSA